MDKQHRPAVINQYSVISHNRKECGKEYIRLTESLCCTAEINTTLSINYISIKHKIVKKPNSSHTRCLWYAPEKALITKSNLFPFVPFDRELLEVRGTFCSAFHLPGAEWYTDLSWISTGAQIYTYNERLTINTLTVNNHLSFRQWLSHNLY